MNNETIPTRACAVIIRDHNILLMRRVKNGEEYFSFPGGMVESGETPENAAVREMQEEFGITIAVDCFLFDEVARGNDGVERHGYYYLVTRFTGTPVLGGEEKALMSDSNQFCPAWRPLGEAAHLETLYPLSARDRIFSLLENGVL